jgi:CcmD family protein
VGGLGFLFAAFLVAWLVLLLYLVVLSGRLAALRRELDDLKRREGEDSRPN